MNIFPLENNFGVLVAAFGHKLPKDYILLSANYASMAAKTGEVLAQIISN